MMRASRLARPVARVQIRCGASAAPSRGSLSTSPGVAALLESASGQLWIDGAYRPAEGGATFAVLSPRDGKPFAEIADASASDVDAAVVSAQACFDSGWGDSSNIMQRTFILKALAEKLREPATRAAFAELETMDCGKPLSEAEADIDACAGYFDYFAGIAPEALKASPLPTGTDEPFTASLAKEPVGVVGCITPWNYPMMQAVLKVAPALAAGCTVVLKPAPNSSLTCVALAKLAADAGLPAGALNVSPTHAIACRVSFFWKFLKSVTWKPIGSHRRAGRNGRGPDGSRQHWPVADRPRWP